MTDIKAGEAIEAGTLILVTSGEYSDYGITGLYRAKTRFVVPRKPPDRQTEREAVPDVYAMTCNPDWLEETIFREAWVN